MPFALLLAMQAAGMVVDYMGTKSQAEYGKMGMKIQNAGIEANIYQTRLEAEDSSLQAMKDLRKNLGTQLAVMSARGTSSSNGSSVALFQESLSNFNSDERMRRMNQLGRENELKAGKSIAKLNQDAAQSKLWQGWASRSINTISSNPRVYNNMFGSKNTGNYGLTPVGA